MLPLLSFAQQPDKLVAEISPVLTAHHGLFLNVQGKLSYAFNKYLSIYASHNQELIGGLGSAVADLKKYNYRRNALSELALGITLYTSEKPRVDPTEETPERSWVQKLLRVDAGLCYFKYANKRPDYYTYDVDDQGNYKIINSTNRLSASLGFSFVLREYNTKDPVNIKLKRQHVLSLGAYYGLNYDLQGYIKIEGESSPSQRAPKIYTFNRGGYYFRYNFRQQLTKHFFLGAELFFARMPYVNYHTNPEIPFYFRGGEAEPKIQPYAGITCGWAF